MLYVEIPNDREIARLFSVEADACVSIYVRTTPITPDVGASRIDFSNLVRQAMDLLEVRGLSKERQADLKELLDELRENDEYWLFQANTLCVLATPDEIWTFRLANHIESRLDVSDRFNIKPLLRATTFDHSAYVIAVSEKSLRLVEIFSDMPPEVIEVPDQPRDLESALYPDGRRGNKPGTRTPGAGDRGQTGARTTKRDLAKYCRRIVAALAPALRRSDIPVIVMAVEPTASAFHAMCTAENLLPQIISQSPDRLSPAQIAAEARKVLEVHYQEKIAALQAHYQQRLKSHRSSDSLEAVSDAATSGRIETLYIDIDSDGVVSEITRQALATGAKVVALRKADMPGAGEVAATLRYAIA